MIGSQSLSFLSLQYPGVVIDAPPFSPALTIYTAYPRYWTEVMNFRALVKELDKDIDNSGISIARPHADV
jgi:hypothetical protein